MKYLEQLALGKSKEMKKLETVLFTLLEASESDIKLIKKARKKATGGILGYFSSSSQVAKPIEIKKALGEKKKSEQALPEAGAFILSSSSTTSQQKKKDP